MKSTEKNGAMQPYLSGMSIWVLAVGTSVGWGSLVVTCSDYLLAAGPVGTILGLLIGAFSMLVITLYTRRAFRLFAAVVQSTVG